MAKQLVLRNIEWMGGVCEIYGCSFDAKLSLKKKIFFEKIFVFYKIYIICTKNVFIWKKKFYNVNAFYWKKLFYREKCKWKCKKYISHFK